MWIADGQSNPSPLMTTASTDCEPRHRFAERSRRQQAPVSEAAGAVDDRDLDVTGERVVLESVIAEDHVAGVLEQTNRISATHADRDRHFELSRQQQGLVAHGRSRIRRRHEPGGATLAPVTAKRHADTQFAMRKLPCKPDAERRLAGTADSQVADDDDRTPRPVARQPAPAVQRASQARDPAEQPCDRQQPRASPWLAIPGCQEPVMQTRRQA